MSVASNVVPTCTTCHEYASTGQVCWHCHQITKGFPLHDVHGKGCYKEFYCSPPKMRDVCEYCFIENHAEHQIYKDDLARQQRQELSSFEKKLGNDDHFRILAPEYLANFNASMRIERRTQARKRQYREIVSLRDKEASLRVDVRSLLEKEASLQAELDDVRGRWFTTKVDFNTYVLAINKDSVKKQMIGKYDFIE